MKVTVITACYNSSATIEDTIRSVISQKQVELEYIIVDGASKDDTLSVVNKYKDRIAKVISEPDKGIYDALNKGVAAATGDIVAILHADDFYSDENVLSDVVSTFRSQNCDAVYGDLQYVRNDKYNTVFRLWRSGKYKHGMFYYGWMPPHPSFFVKRSLYQKFGVFNTTLTSAADYELMLRFIHKNRISLAYLPRVLVKMRIGGKSNESLANRIKANREDKKAWEINGLSPRFYTFFLKPLRKIGQFFFR